MGWKELHSNNIPTYYKLCKCVVNEIITHNHVQTNNYFVIGLIDVLAFIGIAQFATDIGQQSWQLVLKKYILFIRVCAGIWTPEAVVGYGLQQILNDYVDKDDEMESFPKILAMIVGPRAILFQIIPLMATVSSIVLAFVGTPLIISGMCCLSCCCVSCIVLFCVWA